MLTLFTTAKPFKGHIGVIQRNALQSWKLIHPDVEIILFGDDDGAAEVCRELGIRHVPKVRRNAYGTKYLASIFDQAQEIATRDVLCYVNCDVILMQDFARALERVRGPHEAFLMVGRRWDVDLADAVEFGEVGVELRLRELARLRGIRRGPDGVDYFTFPRGLYRDLPALVVGRIWWDHWLVWKARSLGAAVVDVSSQVMAIHQNHDYGYHPAGAAGVWNDEQARRNYTLAGGRRHLYTIADATHVLEAGGERANWGRLWAPYWRLLRPKVAPGWLLLLDVTRPLRRRLGLGRVRLRREPRATNT